MATKIAPQSRSTLETASLSLTDTQLQKMISNINETQTEAIAKQIISNIMLQLDIDILHYQLIPGKIDLMTVYDGDSEFLATLLTPITKHLSKVFSTTTFIETGISLVLFNRDKTGLLDQITDTFLANRVKNGIARNDELKNCFYYSMTLAADKLGMVNRFDSTSELVFKIEEITDYHINYSWRKSISTMQEDVDQSIIYDSDS